MFKRQCPKCNSDMFYSSKDSLRCGIKRNSTCCSSHSGQHRVGIKQSDEVKQKISITNKGKEYNRSNLGKKFSNDHRKNLSKSLKGRIPGFGEKQHSSDTRLKQRIARLADLDTKFPNGWKSVNYNKSACILFDEINKEMGWNGQHAENGGEVRMLGYLLDYYEPKQNVVIEFDEPRHEIPSIKKKDEIKQQEITSLLNCKFYRIKQGEESRWREIIV